MKRCSGCKQHKSAAEFYNSSTTKDGLDIYCVPCSKAKQKAYRDRCIAQGTSSWKRRSIESKTQLNKANRARALKKLYDLTPEQLEIMKEDQQGRCRICGKEVKLVVDHCHVTGKVRALLCSPCNKGIGIFNDDPLTIQRAADYLSDHDG